MFAKVFEESGLSYLNSVCIV